MIKPIFALTVLALLAGCASERVILLPATDGQASAVLIRDSQGEIRLDQPYAAGVRRFGSLVTYQATAEEVATRYNGTLVAMPPRPSSYLLYFREGSNQLTPASEAEFAKIRDEIAGRVASEVMVIGHTDRVGSASTNQALSLKRAEMIRSHLLSVGIAADVIEAVGRGENEPLVPTEDDVDEPKNRRVEISIR